MFWNHFHFLIHISLLWNKDFKVFIILEPTERQTYFHELPGGSKDFPIYVDNAQEEKCFVVSSFSNLLADKAQ